MTSRWGRVLRKAVSHRSKPLRIRDTSSVVEEEEEEDEEEEDKSLSADDGECGQPTGLASRESNRFGVGARESTAGNARQLLLPLFDALSLSIFADDTDTE